MKSNSVFIMFLVVLAVTVVFALVLRVCFLDRLPDTDEAPKAEHAILIEEKKPEIITEDAMKEYENADRLVIELVERTTIEEEKGFETEYDRYIVSDVDFKAQTDNTQDYHDAILESDGEIGEGTKISFKEAFGTSYARLDGRTLYERLLKQCGFSTDYNEVTFDDATHELTGQNLYIYDNKCDVTDHLLEGEVCDEILESKVCYQLGDGSKTAKVPEYFSASVTFKVKDQVVTKSLYLSVVAEKSDEGKGVADA